MTLVELLLALAIGSVLVGTTVAISIPWLARENVRGAVFEVQTAFQTARIEAVSRNRDCRVVVDTSTGTLEVWDSRFTPTVAGDDLLLQAALPGSVGFASPDGGSPVTLTDLGGSRYECVFNSDGTVSSGTGEVVLFGGNAYGRVTLHGAGGLQVDHWNGTAWYSAF